MNRSKKFQVLASFSNGTIVMLLGILSLFILSCQSGTGGQFGAKPKALGVAGQITIIAEDDLWEGPVGDSLDFYLASMYPVLPRPEPLFDLRHFNPFEIQVESLRRELRTYLLCVNTADTASRAYKMAQTHLGSDALNIDEPKLKLVRDKWATDQILLYLIGPNEEQLAASVEEYFPKISEQVRAHDLKQIQSKAYLKGDNPPLIKKVKSKFDISMKVPADFVTAMEEDSLLWLRKDYEDVTVNLVMQLLPYTSQEQFSKEYIKTVRNHFGRQYVSSSSENSFMIINDEDLPMYTFNRQVNGNFALEARGIWEMENDFMGGPFASYLIHLKEQNALLYVDGFVLAPGHSKKEIMQQLEVIVNSIQSSNQGT